MAKYKLKSVRFIHGVPFVNGPVQPSIQHTDAESLTYDDQSQLVIAVPRKARTDVLRLVVPMGNVAYFEELDEVSMKERLEKAKVVPAPEPARPVVNDTIVLTPGKK